MVKKVISLFLLFLLFFLLNVSPMNAKEKSLVTSNSLERNALRAFVAIEAAKLNALSSYPYARITPQSKIQLNNRIDYYQFKQRAVTIIEDTSVIGGPCVLSLLCACIDDFGRRDFSRNRIVYSVAEPTLKEKSAITKSIVNSTMLIRQIGNSTLKNELQKSIVAYQKAKGLPPDGSMGNRMILSMLEDISIVDVQELTTSVVYPEKPRFSAYILPSSAIQAGYQKFNRGFASMPEVKKNALSLAELKRVARPNDTFVVFIYFLDRVNPTAGRTWGLSATSNGRSEAMSAEFFANPGTWPVVVETFTVEEPMKMSHLFVNIFSKRDLIGSYEIK